MIFLKEVFDPFTEHLWFAWYPIKVFEVQDRKNKKVLIIRWVWLQKVIRRLDKNLSGTFRWTYFLR